MRISFSISLPPAYGQTTTCRRARLLAKVSFSLPAASGASSRNASAVITGLRNFIYEQYILRTHAQRHRRAHKASENERFPGEPPIIVGRCAKRASNTRSRESKISRVYMCVLLCSPLSLMRDQFCARKSSISRAGRRLLEL